MLVVSVIVLVLELVLGVKRMRLVAAMLLVVIAADKAFVDITLDMLLRVTMVE